MAASAVSGELIAAMETVLGSSLFGGVSGASAGGALAIRGCREGSERRRMYSPC